MSVKCKISFPSVDARLEWLKLALMLNGFEQKSSRVKIPDIVSFSFWLLRFKLFHPFPAEYNLSKALYTKSIKE